MMPERLGPRPFLPGSSEWQACHLRKTSFPVATSALMDAASVFGAGVACPLVCAAAGVAAIRSCDKAGVCVGAGAEAVAAVGLSTCVAALAFGVKFGCDTGAGSLLWLSAAADGCDDGPCEEAR